MCSNIKMRKGQYGVISNTIKLASSKSPYSIMIALTTVVSMLSNIHVYSYIYAQSLDASMQSALPYGACIHSAVQLNTYSMTLTH